MRPESERFVKQDYVNLLTSTAGRMQAPLRQVDGSIQRAALLGSCSTECAMWLSMYHCCILMGCCIAAFWQQSTRTLISFDKIISAEQGLWPQPYQCAILGGWMQNKEEHRRNAAPDSCASPTTAVALNAAFATVPAPCKEGCVSRRHLMPCISRASYLSTPRFFPLRPVALPSF